MSGLDHFDTVDETAVPAPAGFTVGTCGSGSSSGGLSGVIEAAAPLQVEEAARGLVWGVAIVILSGSALAFSIFLPGEGFPMGVFRVSLTVLLLTSLWFIGQTWTPANYNTLAFRIFGMVAATTQLGLIYYLGPMSPTPVAVMLGIGFFGLGLDRIYAIVVPIYAMSGYLFLCVATMYGWVPDVGLVRTSAVSFATQLFFTCMVPMVYTVGLWTARMSRQTMESAIAASNRAVRVAGQRGRRIEELQQNLEEVLRAGEGVAGRYTGTNAGIYEVAEVIGRGAMGDVYAASHAGLESVAVKVLRPDRLDSNHLQRFVREGELAALVKSPHIVAVYDVGIMDDGVPYIAMERLAGEDLAGKLRRHARLSLSAVNEMVQQVAQGLLAAHGAGIIHRDLKPGNLFRSEGKRGQWKILDFGVSRLQSTSSELTQAAIIGTPGYMSPEQARGQTATPLADLFGLSAVVYRCITGAPPFPGGDVPQVLYRVTYCQPLRPSSVVEIPKGVDAVLAIAMSKNPQERFASVDEFAVAFAQAATGELSETLRARAEAAIAHHPWGTEATHN